VSTEHGDELPQSEAKRHHFVPAFLIAQWATPPRDRNGRLYQLDKATGRPTRVRASEVGHIRQFYAVVNPQGDRDTATETALSMVDGQAAGIVTSMLAGNVPSDEERAELALFLAFQDMRTPHGQGRLLDQTQGMMLGFLRFIADEPEAFHSAWLRMDPDDKGEDPEEGPSAAPKRTGQRACGSGPDGQPVYHDYEVFPHTGRRRKR
jgi:hypothetical protein